MKLSYLHYLVTIFVALNYPLSFSLRSSFEWFGISCSVFLVEKVKVESFAQTVPIHLKHAVLVSFQSLYFQYVPKYMAFFLNRSLSYDECSKEVDHFYNVTYFSARNRTSSFVGPYKLWVLNSTYPFVSYLGVSKSYWLSDYDPDNLSRQVWDNSTALALHV